MPRSTLLCVLVCLSVSAPMFAGCGDTSESDPCAEAPCENGTCISLGDTYICECDEGNSADGDVCVPVVCEEMLAAPVNGSVTADGNTYGSVATYACEDGFFLSHEEPRSCLADGSWSGAAPICVEPCDPTVGGPACGHIVCEEVPTAPVNGSVTANGNTYGSVATYACDEGFVLSHEEPQSCLADGTWSGAAPTCFSPEACLEQAIQDPSFEGGPSAGFWEAGSHHFWTPICNEEVCGSYIVPRSGTYHAWLGRSGANEEAFVAQMVVIPIGHPGQLNFWLRRNALRGNAVTKVSVDGDVLRSFPDPPEEEDSHVPYTVDVSAYADGEEHDIRFHFASFGGTSNHSLDDITLDCEAIEPTP